MELLKNTTNQIQINLTSNLYIRAKYLYSLYQPLYKELLNKNDYLDIGCGYGVNSEVFGEKFDNIYCSDLSTPNLAKCNEYMNRNESVSYIAADAQRLPFKNEHFGMVTAFSLIEHIPDQEKMIQEALRVLKKDGQLVMQFPNKYFFMELHTGFPFYCLVPDIAKPWILKKLSYYGLINVPTPEQIKRIVGRIDTSVKVKVIKVVYPDELVPFRFRKVYYMLKKFGVFRFIPFGWLVICEK